MSCAGDHAHDVMRREPEQCFTVDILLNVSVRLKIMVSNRSAVCRTYEIMHINECIVEHRTVQRVSQLFYMYIIHVALILFVLRVRGVTYPKVYELTPPHGTPLTPRSQELTPNRNHHGTPALTDRFFDWFLTFLRDLVHFASICGCFTFDPNVKVRMAHLEMTKLVDAIPIVGTTLSIFKHVLHVVFHIGTPTHPSTRETAYPTTHKTCAIGKSARHTDTYPYICNLFHEIPFQSSTFSILS